MYVIVRHTITSIEIERGTKARKHSAPTKFKIAQVGSEELNFCVVVTHDKNRQQQKIFCQENISSNMLAAVSTVHKGVVCVFLDCQPTLLLR